MRNDLRQRQGRVRCVKVEENGAFKAERPENLEIIVVGNNVDKAHTTAESQRNAHEEAHQQGLERFGLSGTKDDRLSAVLGDNALAQIFQ